MSSTSFEVVADNKLDPFHNPTYPQREHILERPQLEQALRSCEERIFCPVLKKLNALGNHTLSGRPLNACTTNCSVLATRSRSPFAESPSKPELCTTRTRNASDRLRRVRTHPETVGEIWRLEKIPRRMVPISDLYSGVHLCDRPEVVNVSVFVPRAPLGSRFVSESNT